MQVKRVIVPIFSVMLGCASCSEGPTVVPPLLATAQCGERADIGVLFDKSGSMETARTTAANANDLHPLIDSLLECGSELAVGFIRDRNETGMRRLRFAVQPGVPDLKPKGEKEPDYQYLDRLADHNRKLAARREAIEAVKEKRRPEIDEYLAGIQQALSTKPSRTTDFNSAMNQADIFLAEAGSASPGRKKYLIVVSDALDTARRRRLEFTSGAAVLWVNTTTDKKIMAGTNATRFESFASAVLHVAGEMRR